MTTTYSRDINYIINRCKCIASEDGKAEGTWLNENDIKAIPIAIECFDSCNKDCVTTEELTNAIFNATPHLTDEERDSVFTVCEVMNGTFMCFKDKNAC